MGFRKKKTLLDQAKEQASDFADTVRPQIEAAVATAKEKSGPVIADARDKAAPYVADARDKAAPYVAEAKEKLNEGRDAAAAKALVGLSAAEAKVASLQSEPPKKKGRFRKVLVFGALAGLAAFAVKKLTADKGDNWQSTYTPPPPPAPAPAPPTAAKADEAAGAAPGEAIADSAEEPHPVTTPDDPAEVVDIEDDKKA
ncbi:hypothetical protein RDV89_08135 [Nocardioides zeae]|uniref:Uncharacterized protein n=1 Tax=Nocardioides imazamoxiresistens TaxID=3231893 RepID=A0ABU3PUX7_9ACTN|nr:hypothetical protein [Nocardioides zeae]MDT9593033.1 hypothetical protein [Nocardioides zeae]